MAVPNTITIVEGHLKVGTSEAALISQDCQITSAAVNALPNLVTRGASFCAPESQTAAASGWELAVSAFQDWEDPDGICWFCFEHDTEEIYWELALSDDDDAIMHGQATLTALSFGGDAGTPLVASATWPCVTKPDKGGWSTPSLATGATAGTPGAWTPPGNRPPDRLADATGITPTPATAWTEGQWIITDVGEEIRWTGSAWQAGRVPEA